MSSKTSLNFLLVALKKLPLMPLSGNVLPAPFVQYSGCTPLFLLEFRDYLVKVGDFGLIRHDPWKKLLTFMEKKLYYSKHFCKSLKSLQLLQRDCFSGLDCKFFAKSLLKFSTLPGYCKC